MKTLVVMLFVVINPLACNFGSVSYKQKSEGEGVVTSFTPDTKSCVEKNFKSKTEGEIAAMPPRELFDERVKKEIYRDTFPSFAAWADYGILVDKYIRKSGVNMFPVLTEYINGYDPKNASKCEAMRFSVASFEANDLDRFVFRLRGSKEGKSTITALERAVERMKEAGYDDKKRDYDDNRRFRIEERHLGYIKGVNEVDRALRIHSG